MNSHVNNSNLYSVSRQEPITVCLTDRLSAKFYADCRPHCMETASLQKGLTLTHNDKELIEEGMGFGAPVVKYQDKTYFSSTAELSLCKKDSTCQVTKTFVLDTISRKKIWRTSYINDDLYSSIRKTFAKLYLTKKDLFPLFNATMELRQIAKIRTDYIQVKPRGSIKVSYCLHQSDIKISIDFSNLALGGSKELLILNEQGSTCFEKYLDSNGLRLYGSKIGAWDIVAANNASLINTKESLAFSLQNIDGAKLFRGWERTRNRFSWAGLSYSLNPNTRRFDYKIKLVESSKDLVD